MPSARHAQTGAVAGPKRRFNVGSRAAVALLSGAIVAHAASPGFEAPATGFVFGVEVGTLAASAFGAHDTSSWLWALGLGGAAGAASGAWVGGLDRDPTATTTLRATTLALAIPSAVLLWSWFAEPPRASASEDASPLAPSASTHTSEKSP